MQFLNLIITLDTYVSVYLCNGSR